MRTKILYFVALILYATNSFAQNSDKFWMPSVFSDNMVLQQKAKVNIWGQSFAGDKITIAASWGKSARVVANADGKWIVSLETVAAGGPYSLTLVGVKSKKEIKGILLGEVWLCSGQSNMEMPLKGWLPKNPIMHSKEEIEQSANPKLRMFTVAKSFSVIPENECVGQWEEASPATVGNFSASAYFFGKKLFSELNVPIGLIHTSWGGTPAEAWTSSDALKMYPDFAPVVTNFQGLLKESQKSKDWMTSHPFVALKSSVPNPWAGLLFNDEQCSSVALSDTGWATISLPKEIESVIGTFDGAFWLRKWIEVPQSWVGKELVLDLPGVDDMDRTYINGELVGATEETGFWQALRHYTVASNIIKPGLNLIAIRVVDNGGGGGISDVVNPMELKIKAEPAQSIKLAGKWSYLPVAEFFNNGFYLYDVAKQDYRNKPKTSFDLNQYTPTALYNAMIQPLVPYTIKGAIWYQGESNVGRAKQYQTLFPLMIESWRKSFAQGNFPFYFVQIAPYIYSGKENIESAEIREAQRLSLQKVDKSGMVVTLDIGNVDDIHPANKTDIGNRLALWALAKNYNKNITCSGPLYKYIKIEGNKAIISFDYAEKGLKAVGNLDGFEVAGSDKNYVSAVAQIKGKTVVVSSEKVDKPAYVRYAFKNGSTATLFNVEGLPASTFSTEK
jgi:sialate O-acetylesterase